MEKEVKDEILDILDNVTYWDSCPQEHKERISAIKKALNSPVVMGCVCPECANERAFSNKLGWCFCHDCGHEWQI